MRPCIFTLRKLPRADIESAPTVTGWRMPYGIRRGAFYMLPRANNVRPQIVKKGALTPWPPLRGGSARRRWGRELYGCPKYFGLWQGSLPPPLRGTSPSGASATSPVSGESVSQREAFRRSAGEQCSPLQSLRRRKWFFDKLTEKIAYYSILRISCTRSAITMGLVRKPFMPLSRALRRSSSKAFAVMARMGMPARAGFFNSRMRRVAV